MKHKTKKAASKRFTLSAKGKLRRRPTGQAHFNARATGEEGRRKHGSAGISNSDTARIHDILPHLK